MLQTSIERTRTFPISLPKLGNAERLFWKGVGLTALFMFGFYLVYLVEKEVLGLRSSQRWVIDCIEAPMRFFTIAHIIVATLFLATAKKNQNLSRRLSLAALSAVGVALCLGWYSLADTSQIWDMKHGTNLQVQAHLLILTYFLVHEVRDEIFFYRIMGDAPKDAQSEELDRLHRGIITFMPMTLLAFYLWPHQILSAENRLPFVIELSSPWNWIVAMIPAAGSLAYLGLFLSREARRAQTSVGGFIKRHAPLFRVMAGVMGTVAVGSLIFQRGSLLILLHVCIWYVFAVQGLKARRPAVPPSEWWAWMRSTPEGFRVLHLGLFVLAATLGFLCVYVTGVDGWLWAVMSPAAFAHWSIMHITLSFMPRQ